MAAYGAKLAVRNALNGDARGHLYRSTGRYVRFDEKKAREQGKDVKTSVLGLEHVPRALTTRDTRGLNKLVADKTTDRLLGAHMIAPETGDSIQTAAIAIKSKMTATDLGNMIFPYLTMVEGLKLAAKTFDKDVNKLTCCAG